jgi:hypothetical protein
MQLVPAGHRQLTWPPQPSLTGPQFGKPPHVVSGVQHWPLKQILGIAHRQPMKPPQPSFCGPQVPGGQAGTQHTPPIQGCPDGHSELSSMQPSTGSQVWQPKQSIESCSQLPFSQWPVVQTLLSSQSESSSTQTPFWQISHGPGHFDWSSMQPSTVSQVLQPKQSIESCWQIPLSQVPVVQALLTQSSSSVHSCPHSSRQIPPGQHSCPSGHSSSSHGVHCSFTGIQVVVPSQQISPVGQQNELAGLAVSSQHTRASHAATQVRTPFTTPQRWQPFGQSESSQQLPATH